MTNTDMTGTPRAETKARRKSQIKIERDIQMDRQDTRERGSVSKRKRLREMETEMEIGMRYRK